MHARTLLLPFLLSLALPAAAQSTGYELALDGNPSVTYGQPLHLNGIAFEVQGYAGLRPLTNGRVTARLRQTESDGRTRRIVTLQEITVDTDSSGHFSLELPIPEAAMTQPNLQVAVGRGQQARTFDYALGVQSPLAFDVLTDRVRYEPGETAHVWTRLRRDADDAPVSGRAVSIRVTDPSGRPVAEEQGSTGPDGVVHVAVALPEAAMDGGYTVQASTTDAIASANGNRSFTVARRTVERLLVTVEIDQVVVPPSARVTGTVTVRTPSGAPVPGAQVTLVAGDEPTELQTGDDGTASIRIQAPAYLASDVAMQQVVAQVRHPAHGAMAAAASYLLSRVAWKVEARAEAGALVPETDGEVYIAVTDPRGGPAPAGTEIEVRGDLVRGRQVRRTVGAHGLAAIPARVPEGAATVVRESGSTCYGQYAAPLEVEVLGERPVVARTCVRVAPEARVLVRAEQTTVAPGGRVSVVLSRHSDVRTRDVLVEALANGRTVAAMFTGGARAELQIPPGVGGVITLRARPVLPPDARHESSEPGGAAFGTGSMTAVLVRPDDAFGLTIETERRWRVQETATLGFRTSTSNQAPTAFVAYVARDLAAHGGEQPWTLEWMRSSLGQALTEGGDDGDLYVRATMAATLEPDTEPNRSPPLVPPPWRDAMGGYSGPRHGQMRDAVALRDEMLRRSIGALEVNLERLTEQLVNDDESRVGFIEGTGASRRFHPDAIATLVAKHLLNETMAQTLGGEPATIAMIRAADPSFDFDTVAQRIARKHLMELMAAVTAFSNPDDPNAARASSGHPPERWLSRMVQLGVLQPAALLDPWGNPFVLRAATSPRFVLSARAPRHELASAGPDGRLGTGDDLRDPFERAVTAGSPYAVASGEDALMSRLSVISTGPMTLSAMAQAYDAVSLETLEEQQGSAVSANASEGDDMDGREYAMGALGGAFADEMAEAEDSGVGYGRGGGGMMPAAAPPAQPMRSRRADTTTAMDAEAQLEIAPSEQRNQQMRDEPSVFGSMAAVVREEFPATLVFVPSIPLDGASTNVTLQLADALTTYRIEAIAWTTSGWTTTASTEIEVDQDATVDAPVPPFATVGDHLRLPVRVANRTGAPLEVRVAVHSEDLTLDTGAPRTVTVPPRDAVEVVFELAPGTAGSGALRLEVTRPSGEPLDAVRRPLIVWPDARTVRVSRELLAEPGQRLTLEIPRGASERGPAGVRIAPGAALFGEPTEIAGGPAAGWLLTLGGAEVPEEIRAMARAQLRADAPSDDVRLGGSPIVVAQALSVAWADASVDEAILFRALRTISASIPQPESQGAGVVDFAASTLLALAPAQRASSTTRGSARVVLADVVSQLQSLAGDAAVALDADPERWVAAALGLALTGEANLARELLRRAERHVIDLGDEAFLEGASQYGEPLARVSPTARIASAYAALDDRPRALEFLRSLVAQRSSMGSWGGDSRIAAATAATLLAGGRPSEVRVRVDGNAVTLTRQEGGIWVGEAAGLGAPGEHTVEVDAGNAPALAFLDVRYGLPWTAEIPRRARVDLDVDGALGPRDTRAGLAITLRNREPRLMSAPMLEIDLPAGTELDEPTREQLAGLLAAPATMEGRTLRLPLAPLAPGGYVRVPLPLRWSVGGDLRGLGASVYDEAAAPESRGTAVLPSRALTIEDRGEAVEPAESDAGPDPEPDPPMIPFEQIAPVAWVHALPSEVVS